LTKLSASKAYVVQISNGEGQKILC